jgi:hypothetical protein
VRPEIALSEICRVVEGTLLRFDQRWARWQEKGARHDARVGRYMRLAAAIALTLGVICSWGNRV